MTKFRPKNVLSKRYAIKNNVRVVILSSKVELSASKGAC